MSSLKVSQKSSSESTQELQTGKFAKPAFSNLSQFFTPIHFFFLSGGDKT